MLAASFEMDVSAKFSADAVRGLDVRGIDGIGSWSGDGKACEEQCRGREEGEHRVVFGGAFASDELEISLRESGGCQGLS